MNVHIYTDIDTLFGRAARLWMDVLLEAGHEVEYLDLGNSTSAALPDAGECDVNLLIAGIYALPRFTAVGLPKHGKNLLWMFDPLTRDASATVHHFKTALFDAIAPRLDAVLAMDHHIERYMQRHFAQLPVFHLPYLVAEKHIHAPLPEAARRRDVVMMGGDTPRRREAEQFFRSQPDGPQPDFIWAGMWGLARDTCRAESRISLNIHADSQHTYFDQFRTFEAWALGTPVVSDVFEGAADFGVVPGDHLLMALPQDMPAACAELLKDEPRRQAMAAAAQALLRERFTPAAWSQRMLAMVQPFA